MDISALLALREGITPGPWRIDPCQDILGNRSTATDNGLVCAMCEDRNDEEGRANARAIAAVPDLFAALEAQQAEIAALTEAYLDTKRLARKIDVAMHGEDGAAKQASLCDLVGPAKDLRSRAEEAEAKVARVKGALQSAQESIATFIGVHGYPIDSGAGEILNEVTAALREIGGGNG